MPLNAASFKLNLHFSVIISSWLTATSSVKKLELEVAIFATDSCKFPTDEIVGAHKLILPLNAPKMGDFPPQILYI